MGQDLLEQKVAPVGGHVVLVVSGDHLVTSPPDEQDRPLVPLQLLGNVQVDMVDDSDFDKGLHELWHSRDSKGQQVVESCVQNDTLKRYQDNIKW